jgi:CheY-like chemotaxis protein
MSPTQGNPVHSNPGNFSEFIRHGTFLVVDDFESMREVVMGQLRQLGATNILEAENGAEALKILAERPVTVILSDWNMPVMNGLDFLRAVRSSPELSQTPFVMITAESERSRILQAVEAGVSQLLVKPYTSSRFADHVAQMQNWRPRKRPTVAPRAAGSASDMAARPSRVADKPTLLVVDDTPDNLQLLSDVLRGEYTVKVANNGPRALALCQSDTPPDLVLLDVMMPGMDGFAVAQALRGHPSSEHIPVIFVTSMTDDASRQKGLEVGAVDFVTKPVNPVALRLRIENFMRYVNLRRHLQADNDAMLETVKLRDDVEHITRHDMKGPLAGILGLAQSLLNDASLGDHQRNQVRLLEESTLQVLDMINLSSELYKIETGSFQPRPDTVPLAQILRRLTMLAQKTFAAKNLDMAVATPPGESDDALTATGESMLCYSLFQNLIKNACEAAPEGSRVDIAIHAEDPIRITVQNRGVVPAAIRDRFFDKFVTQGKQGGTGLGTYSARLLARAQGGAIGMETDDTQNMTRLTVTLPR